MKKITVKIIITNEFGQESEETFNGTYDTVYNNEWDEITRGLIDEATSERILI